MGSSGVRRELLQVILQQADFDAAAVDVLGLRSIIRRRGGVAHADKVDAVDRNVVVEHQVAHHGLGHLLRGRDGDLALA